MFNLAVLVSGSGSNLGSIIDAIKNGELNARIGLVVSDNPEAYALERARQNGIEAVYIKKDATKLVEALEKNNTDLVVLAGYLSILEKEVVERYSGKIINIHPSLIPKFCGKGFYGEHVHKAVLEAGEKVSGATVHYVDAGVDTGPIIKQMEVPVYDDDSVEDLQKRVLVVEHKLLPEVIRDLSERG